MNAIKNIGPAQRHLGKEQSGAPATIKVWTPGRACIRAKKSAV